MDVTTVPYQPIEDFFFSPMKLFEGMAVGRPTVAANLGQIPEIVRHGETGVLALSRGTIGSSARVVETLLQDRPLATRIGTASSATCAGPLHLDACNERSTGDRQHAGCAMKEGRFFSIPERPGDVDVCVTVLAASLVSATRPKWLDENDLGYYRYLGRYPGADPCDKQQTDSFARRSSNWNWPDSWRIAIRTMRMFGISIYVPMTTTNVGR